MIVMMSMSSSALSAKRSLCIFKLVCHSASHSQSIWGCEGNALAKSGKWAVQAVRFSELFSDALQNCFGVMSMHLFRLFKLASDSNLLLNSTLLHVECKKNVFIIAIIVL
jgi:hypothetical protein